MNKTIEILIGKYLSDNISSEEKSELLRWLEKDPGHQVEFDQFKKFWNRSKELKVERDADVDSAWMDLQQRAQRPVSKVLFIGNLRENYLKVAAGLALVISLSIVLNFVLSDTSEELPKIISLKDPVSSSPLPNEYELFIDSLLALTDSEWVFDEPQKKRTKRLLTKNVVMITVTTGDTARVFMLPDNSIVFLNDHSRLEYPDNFGKNNRKLTLTGEAYFEVSRDTTQFVVSCLNTITRGTEGAFNIRGQESEQTVEVILASGRVEFSGVGKQEYKKLELKAGERAVYGKNEQISKAKNNRKDYKWWQKKNLRAKLKRFIENVKSSLKGKN